MTGKKYTQTRRKTKQKKIEIERGKQEKQKKTKLNGRIERGEMKRNKEMVRCGVAVRKHAIDSTSFAGKKQPAITSSFSVFKQKTKTQQNNARTNDGQIFPRHYTKPSVCMHSFFLFCRSFNEHTQPTISALTSSLSYFLLGKY